MKDEKKEIIDKKQVKKIDEAKKKALKEKSIVKK